MSPAQVRLSQIRVSKEALGKVGAREVTPGEIGLTKINVHSNTIYDLDPTQVQANERRVADGGLDKANPIFQPAGRPMCLSPVNANQLRALEPGGREGALWHLNKAQVAPLKGAVDEPAVAES